MMQRWISRNYFVVILVLSYLVDARPAPLFSRSGITGSWDRRRSCEKILEFVGAGLVPARSTANLTAGRDACRRKPIFSQLRTPARCREASPQSEADGDGEPHADRAAIEGAVRYFMVDGLDRFPLQDGIPDWRHFPDFHIPVSGNDGFNITSPWIWACCTMSGYRGCTRWIRTGGSTAPSTIMGVLIDHRTHRVALAITVRDHPAGRSPPGRHRRDQRAVEFGESPRSRSALGFMFSCVTSGVCCVTAAG